MKTKAKAGRTVTILAAGTGLILALSSCAGGGRAVANDGGGSLQDMEPITISWTDYNAESSSYGKAFQAFAAEVEEKTDGKVTFEPYYSSALMPGEEFLTGVGSGAADMGNLGVSYFPTELPITNWQLNMGSMTNKSFPHGILSGSAAAREAFVGNDALVAEFTDHNLKVLTATNHYQQYDLLCTKPVDSLADAKGLRTRVGGGVWVKEVEALGMIPVPLPVGEMYEGLQRGVIDCVVLHTGGDIDYGLWEIAPHYTPISMSTYPGSAVAINLDTWNALPADVQQIVEDASGTLWETVLTNSISRYAQFAIEGPEKHNIQFHDPRELDKVLASHQESVTENLADLAPASLKDPEGFIADYRASLEKWTAVLTDELQIPLRERDPATIKETFKTGENFDVSKFSDIVHAESAKQG
jgi:TRAP-type C4-dicarboxylate transport system substrate-binding protein